MRSGKSRVVLQWRYLSRTGRIFAHTTWCAFSLLLATAVYDIGYADGRLQRSLTYVAGFLLSVIASASIGVIIELGPARERIRAARGIAGLFGIPLSSTTSSESSSDRHRVAIVLPSFHAAADSVRPRDLGGEWRLPVSCSKNSIDLGDSATFVKRDVILASEISQLIAQVGIRQPLFTDDVKVLHALRERRGGSDELTIRSTDGSFLVHSMIVIGLWSNGLSAAIADADSVKELEFQTTPDGRREILLRGSGGTQLPAISYKQYSTPELVEAGTDCEPALIFRRRFAGMNVVIVGGMTSLGTVRLGDYLLRDGGWKHLIERLAAKRASEESPLGGAWHVLLCPGRGRGRETSAPLDEDGLDSAVAATLEQVAAESCRQPSGG